MGTIYKIINKTNGKIYIGQTKKSLEKRWKIHLLDCTKFPKRRLYKDILSYGADNFLIEPIESVEDAILDTRESYWIQYYDSHTHGYNETMGGQGKQIYDYDYIAQLILEKETYQEVADEIGCCVDTVSFVGKKYNLKHKPRNNFVSLSKPVMQYDKNGNYIQSFDSYTDAARWLEDNCYVSGSLRGVASHIGEVCSGRRKTAYGFIWKRK